MTNDRIINITESNFKGHNFKYEACLEIINKYADYDKKVYGIGDSAVDIQMLSLADIKFAIDPKGGFENYVDYVINDIEEIMNYID